MTHVPNKTATPVSGNAPVVYDVLVIGGGVNGSGIARDAAGRGLSVVLCEADDLASATSSAATKLFHGGLRYLEYFEFRLVREALKERETLLAAMPHISRAMRFVLPLDKSLRLPSDGTRLSRLIRLTMPWLRGRRPAWLTRIGLFVYDHLGGRKFLPGTRALDLRTHETGAALKAKYRRAFEYSDGWVDDARLVMLNARDAELRGAKIRTRTQVTDAKRVADLWTVTVKDTRSGVAQDLTARALVNAGGPWVETLMTREIGMKSPHQIRLVRGSHIITKKLFDHDQPYFLTLPDGRIIFAIPYETHFTLIGTTDLDHEGDARNPECSPHERDYLIEATNRYFEKSVSAEDVVWSYAGVRPLFSNDNDSAAQAATRDYMLDLAGDKGVAPLLSVFGGKITTFRKLAQNALDQLAPWFPEAREAWTAGAPLPGGDFPCDGFDAVLGRARADWPFLDLENARRLVRAYGTDLWDVFGGPCEEAALGENFGGGVYGAELRWAVEKEYVQTGADFLWRRSKRGLHTTSEEQAQISACIEDLNSGS